MIRKLFTLAATASLAALTVAVYAAEPMTPAGGGKSAPSAAGPPAASAAPPPAAAAAPADPGAGKVSQVRANGPPIVLEASKGSLIRLPRAANTVFIANPDVADVQ